MVSVKPAPPTVVTLGVRPLMAGSAALMVKAAEADVPAAVVTVMPPVPENRIREAETEALSCVGLT